jgi:hypothetical protein
MKDLKKMHVALQQNRAHVIAKIGYKDEVLMKARLARLDRIAHDMNAWLLAIAIGLGMLDLTVLVAKCMPVLPELPVAGDATAAAPQVAAHHLPAVRH